MFSKRTVSFHKVININHFPYSKTVFTQPLHECLKLVLTLKMFWGKHLIFHNNQMLPSVNFIRYRNFVNMKPQRSSDSEKHPQYHVLITLVNFLVLFRVNKSLIVYGKVVWGISNKTDLVWLFPSDVGLGGLVFLSVHWESP